MKKLSILLVLSLMMTNIYAQKDITERAAKSTEKLTAQLDLTPEQQTQVKELYLEKYSKKQANKPQKAEQSKVDRKEMKTAKKAARKDFEGRLNAILTPEQVAKRTADKAERSEKRKAGKGKGQGKAKMKKHKMKHDGKAQSRMDREMTPEKMAKRADNATERMTKKLALNEKQVIMIKDVYNNYYQEVNAFRKEGMTDKDAKSVKRKEIEDNLNSKIEAILNQEQREKWAARQGKRNANKNRQPRAHK